MGKKKKPSTRAGQYKQASRQRASRKRRQELSRSAKFVTYGSGLCMGLVLFGWIIMSGTASQWASSVTRGTHNQLANLGFELNDLFLSGHDKLSKQAILHQTKLEYGKPIFAISLPELQDRLTSLPQIRDVTLTRQLPDTLYIHVDERYPTALWQQGEALHLIDDEGVLMGDGDPIKHNHLPLLVGQDAPQHLEDLMALLDTAPQLKAQFDSAAFVSKRRWNIWLTNGIEIKLPEDNSGDVLTKLEALQQSQPLKASDISSIDLRVPDRMFIRPKIKLIQKAAHQL